MKNPSSTAKRPKSNQNLTCERARARLSGLARRLIAFSLAMQQTFPIRTIISLCVVAAASLLAALPLTAQTVELVATFDYPGTIYTFNSTGHINDDGDYVGTVVGGDATLSGFKGNVSGSFSQPFVFPDNHNVTVPYGINNAGLVCGFYSAPSGFSGFFRRGSHYKSVMPAHSVGTTIESVNNAENFVGQVISRRGVAAAYAVIDQNSTRIPIEFQARASGINNLNEIVGSHDDDAGDKTYGFFRAADGTLTMSIDFPGAVQTMPKAINDSGYIVGVWIDDAQGRHGLVIRLPDTFISYDIPGAENTTLTGINNLGQIIGYYQDAQFVVHGLVAQLIEYDAFPFCRRGPFYKLEMPGTPIRSLVSQIEALTDALKAQAAQIQKVSDQLAVSQNAPATLVDNR